MIGYDYPTFYRCSICGDETSVRRRDTREVPPNPEGASQHELVLQGRGWLHNAIEGILFCPECAGTAA